ncbi:hypothetical protein [Salipiger profundus]|uniref:hypothetical protein n=1 Tax=Salipiger profundus TaxID=1229727 RepID=UPI0008E8FAD2|nr:hypothetical protein [Salipiger profundus]SFE00305.1 hypothetical protein SAMN05444415_1462 [Salipiger profundus]
MTSSEPAQPVDIGTELELIRWKQTQFARITEQVEDALPELMTQIEETVAKMSSLATGRAQMRIDPVWKDIFEPWAEELALGVEAQVKHEVRELTAALSEKGNSKDALRAALPTLASAGVLAASLAAIPTVLGLATVPAAPLFIFATATVSWPIVAAGGAGLAVATLAGGRFVDRLQDRNRAHLVTRLQNRARTATLGHGRTVGERSLVTDLQAAALRTLEAEMETV